MRRWKQLSSATLLFAVVGCGRDAVLTEPTIARVPVDRSSASATGSESPDEVRYTFADGRWISIDLTTRVLRISTGQSVSEVPDAEAVTRANLLGSMETVESYFEANPVPDPVMWCPENPDPNVGCRPYQAVSS